MLLRRFFPYELLRPVELSLGRGQPLPRIRPRDCKHPALTPKFDRAAAEGLDASEVQRRWPRGHGECPDCGAHMIMYASAEHFIWGDW